MAKRGSKKALSVKHELRIAEAYDGVRSPSSGGAATDNGDVRLKCSLVECKFKGSPESPLKQTPKLLQEFEKITEEAWSEGRDPMMALRFYAPQSPLARRDGWVDLAVRLVWDDIDREKAYEDIYDKAR